MGTEIAFTFAALVLVAMTAAFAGLFLKFRGKRIVTCPETHLPVSTSINAAMAAGTWLTTQPRFVVTACSGWPERAGCDQACVPQIEESPEQTLVRSIVTHWYAERACAYCARPIREIGGVVVPALLSVEDELREWRDVAAEDLPRILESSVAVCAPCQLAEGFRRRFPDRVIDRPDTTLHDPSGQKRRVTVEPSQAIY